MASQRLCAALTTVLVVGSVHVCASETDWRQLPLGNEADIASIAFNTGDPPIGLAASAVLYRSTDDGETWTWHPTGIGPLRHLEFLPGTDTVFATNCGGVLWSTDAGLSWAPWGTAPPGGEVQAILVLGPEEVWIAKGTDAGARIFHTVDSGETWAPRTGGLGTAVVHDLARDPSNHDRLVIAAEGGVARTTDSGLTWVWMSVGEEARQVEWYEDQIIRAIDRVFILYPAERLIESTDGGETWVTLLEADGDTESVRRFAADPTDSDYILTAVESGTFWLGGGAWWHEVHRSSDGGVTWSEVLRTNVDRFQQSGAMPLLDRRVRDLQFAGATVRVLVSGWLTPEYLWISPERGDAGSWSTRQTGIHETKIHPRRRRRPSHHVLRRGANGAIHHLLAGPLYFPFAHWSSSDLGQSWEVRDFTPDFDPMWFQVSESSPGRLVAGGLYSGVGGSGGYIYTDSAVVESRDDGATWEHPVRVDRQNGIVVAAEPGTLDRLYVWTSWGGATELRVYEAGTVEIVGPSFRPVDAVVAPENADHVYAFIDEPDPVRFSTDAGTTWYSRSAGLPDREARQLLIDPMDGRHLLAVFKHGEPWRTTNGGETWEALQGAVGRARPTHGLLPPAAELRGTMILSADWEVRDGFARVFLGTDRGLWISDKGLLSLDRLAVRALVYSAWHEHVVVATDSGLFAMPVERLPGVPDPPLPDSSVRFVAAPNPFQSATGVHFEAPVQGGSYRLDVFDVAGRLVQSISGATSTSQGMVVWDGADIHGGAAAPGVYFLRLETGEETRTTRVVRLR